MHFQKVPKLAENSLLNTSKGLTIYEEHNGSK